MSSNNQRALVQWTCLTVLLMALSSGLPVRCQFLQPQSHLGRLVQSITSPLVLSSSLSSASESDSYDSESGPSGPEYAADPVNGRQHYHQPSATHQKRPQFYQQQQRDADSDSGAQLFQHYQPKQRQQQQQQQGYQSAGLQQAPSQQRGVPQHYYGRGGDSPRDDEDSGAPTNHHKQRADGEQYQMGAYLGPTIDDKEIQGAFNANDDKDDDEASSYEGPPSSGGGRQRAASSFAASQPDAAGFSPGAGSYGGYGGSGGSGYDGGRATMGGFSSSADGGAPSTRGNQDEANFDDELGADEDDEPSGPSSRPPRFKSSSQLNQAAASQYQQRQPSYQQRGQQQSGLVAAANGYSPMGAGPFDLSGLMAAAGGVPNGVQAYEVYNGDGSYPGYYQPQQANNQPRGGRNQAASMNGPYGYSSMGQQGNGGRGGDQDDVDNDQDED